MIETGRRNPRWDINLKLPPIKRIDYDAANVALGDIRSMCEDNAAAAGNSNSPNHSHVINYITENMDVWLEVIY